MGDKYSCVILVMIMLHNNGKGKNLRKWEWWKYIFKDLKKKDWSKIFEFTFEMNFASLKSLKRL